MKKSLYIIFLIFFNFLISQNSSFSPYSYFGVGDTNFISTVENNMMGGITSYYDSIHQNINNSASLSKLKFVNYSVGINMTKNTYEINSEKQSSTAAAINYISIAIPTKSFAFSFGIKPSTSIGYILENEDNSKEIPEINRFFGSGGISNAFLSLAFEPVKNLGLGLSGSYAFGNLNHYQNKILQDVELFTRVSSESSVNGLDYNFSSVYQKTFGKNTVHIGLIYKPESYYKSRNSQNISIINPASSGGDTQDIDLASTGLDNTRIKIPSFFSVGLGIGEDKKWFSGLNFKNTNGGGYNNKLLDFDNVLYKTLKSYSFGGFYLPQYDSFTNFFKRIIYRFGIMYNKGGLHVNNKSIDQLSLNFGFGIPIGGISSANLGFEFGERGFNDGGLIKEKFFKIRFGVSLNDIWFIKTMYN